MPMGLACCAIELMASAASKFDISRFGMEVMRFSPRQADCMIVAGTVTYKMAEVVRRIYDQMPDPKWVVAMGACASSGGMYRSMQYFEGVDRIVPVDVYVVAALHARGSPRCNDEASGQNWSGRLYQGSPLASRSCSDLRVCLNGEHTRPSLRL